MIKPASLRAHLVAALPDLARDADRLLVFIDAGSLVSTFQPGLSFEYQYTLNLILTDYAGHPDSVMLPLLGWGDDVVVVPTVLALAARSLPAPVLTDARAHSARLQRRLPWLLPVLGTALLLGVAALVWGAARLLGA